MKIAPELLRKWKAEWLATASHTTPYALFCAEKSAEHMRNQCALVADALRVKGGAEWSADHLAAVQALTDAAAEMRAIETVGEP